MLDNRIVNALWMGRAVLLLGAAMGASPASAQYIGTAAPPPLPAAPRPGEVESPAAALARAVRTLAQRPRDFPALIAAGRAEVDLGDTQAAIGFFGRAEEVRPSDPAPKIGMGAAAVSTGDASGALSWFAQAQQLGATSAAIGADRGLAQDLLGNQPAAQRDYRAALAGPEADDARRRLSLSLGISGQRADAFSILQPLLQRRDPAAQRIRAFVLALVGDERGASGAIEGAMPGAGQRMAGFFRLLPSLSATQKAAAVHLGVFPDPSQIRVAAVAPPPLATPARSKREERAAARAERRALAQSATRTVPTRIEAPSPRAATASAETVPAPRPAPRIIVIDPVPPAATSKFDFSRRTARARPVERDPAPSVALVTPEPGFSSSAPEAAAVPTPLPVPSPIAEAVRADVPTPAFVPEAAVTSSVAEAAPLAVAAEPAPAFATPPGTIVAMSGDRLSGIDRLLAKADELPVPPAPRPRFEYRVKVAAADFAKAKALADRKLAKKVATDRKLGEQKVAAAKQAAADKAELMALGLAGTNWVQLAGGAHADRMATEFKRLSIKSATLRKRGGAVTAGKDYFRLLTGPFASKSDAQSFVNQLAKDGVDGFSWTRTPATIRIEKLAPK